MGKGFAFPQFFLVHVALSQGTRTVPSARCVLLRLVASWCVKSRTSYRSSAVSMPATTFFGLGIVTLQAVFSGSVSRGIGYSFLCPYNHLAFP